MAVPRPYFPYLFFVACTAMAQIEENPLVKFLALDLTSPDSIETVLSHIDYVMQYGEDEEPKEVCAVFFLVCTKAL